jgi:antitoxin (DNA-binding transcriptional repressor) of toxin-antitoxin stability system
MKIDIREAKARLSSLAELVEKRDIAAITRAGKPCIDLVPHGPVRERHEPSRLKGRIRIAPDFDATPETTFEDFERG